MEGSRKSIYDHTWFVPCNEIIRKNSHAGTVFHYENNHTYEISGPSISLPNNFNYRVYPVRFMNTFLVRNFFRPNLPLLTYILGPVCRKVVLEKWFCKL